MSYINVVLAMPTEHSIYAPLRKQFGNVRLFKLVDDEDWVVLKEDGIKALTRKIVDKVSDLPDALYHLILTGHPLPNMLAYEAITQKFGRVRLLSFDSKTRRYLAVPDVPSVVREVSEANKKEKNGGE